MYGAVCRRDKSCTGGGLQRPSEVLPCVLDSGLISTCMGGSCLHLKNHRKGNSTGRSSAGNSADTNSHGGGLPDTPGIGYGIKKSIASVMQKISPGLNAGLVPPNEACNKTQKIKLFFGIK